jgi:hypothetical protein
VSEAKHLTRVVETEDHWTWACSCGAEGDRRFRAEHHAAQYADTHKEWALQEPPFVLPAGVEIVEGPNGLRLRGLQHLVTEAVQGFRVLREKPEGYTTRIGEWTLIVSDFIPEEPRPRVVSLPAHAWNIAASVLADAANGDYGDNSAPFDFGAAAYLSPPPSPDIGIEVIGNAFDDLPDYDPLGEE